MVFYLKYDLRMNRGCIVRFFFFFHFISYIHIILPAKTCVVRDQRSIFEIKRVYAESMAPSLC